MTAVLEENMYEFCRKTTHLTVNKRALKCYNYYNNVNVSLSDVTRALHFIPHIELNSGVSGSDNWWGPDHPFAQGRF